MYRIASYHVVAFVLYNIIDFVLYHIKLYPHYLMSYNMKFHGHIGSVDTDFFHAMSCAIISGEVT